MRRSRTLRLLAPLLLGAIVVADTPITVSPGSTSAASDRLRESARLAIARFDEWLAPLPQRQLTVATERWDSARAGLYAAGEVFATSRWLMRAHERDADRLLVGAIARQYWLPRATAASAEDAVFVDGIADYLAVRAMHTIFLGTHDYDTRYFGGFIPHVMRALPLSSRPDDARPPVTWFAELERVRPLGAAASPGARAIRRRVAAALFTIERVIGWPTLQVALQHFWAQPRMTRGDFLPMLDEVSGRALAPFVARALDERTVFDYAVTELSSTLAGDAAHPYETTVTVTREAGILPGVELAVWFADGIEARERWDGEGVTRTFRFASRAPARAAQIDPDTVLLLDQDRRNNIRSLERHTNPRALGGAARWLVWLQNLMLSYGGLA